MLRRPTAASQQTRSPRTAGCDMVGIAEGAAVVTTRGAVSVEHLRGGDLLVSRSHGVVRLLRTEHHSLVTRGIYIFAGSFGHLGSDRDTLLPAGQPVLVRDWRARALFGRDEVIAPAWTLVDGEHVRDLGLMPMTVYHLFCHGAPVLYADGMELGTADALYAADYSG